MSDASERPENEGALESHPSVAHLPAYPATRQDYVDWAVWAGEQFGLRRMPLLLADFGAYSPEARTRLIVAWRAIVAHWARDRTVAPDDAPLIAYYFLLQAQLAPPFVMLAASRLTRACIQGGATSTDVLFLCAAWAWPLRDVDDVLSEMCWQYLVHAPWQSDPLNLKDVLFAVETHQGWRDGRTLIDLIDARLEAGHISSARYLLEANALSQARKNSLDEILSYRDFVVAPLVEGANIALVRLAHLYHEHGEDQVYAREIMKRAAELTRSRVLVDYIEDQIWERSLEEAYRWSETLRHPRQLDHEISRALISAQPHHARRLAEAVMIRKFYKPWYGVAQEQLPQALDRFRKQLQIGPPADPVARRASEHLAALYARTHHITQHARDFVHSVTDSIAYTGKGASLHRLRDELETFYNSSDPYHIMRRETSLLESNMHALSDDERAASAQITRWFSERFSPEKVGIFDRVLQLLVAPMMDVAKLSGELPMLEEVCRSAFGVMAERGNAIAGDLRAISLQAAKIRSEYGHGTRLMEYAREVTAMEVRGATLLAASTSFLPPGLSLMSHAADLGASLMLAFRVVARIGAVFGKQIQGEEGFRFVANAFTVGLSSKDGEGLFSYMSTPNSTIATSLSIGGVAYGATRLTEYLWVAPRASGERPSERLIRQLARLCGFELQHTAAARMVPVIGAMLSGVSTYTFMRAIRESAIHVAARDALLVHVTHYDS